MRISEMYAFEKVQHSNIHGIVQWELNVVALHHAIYDLKLKNLIFIIMTNVRNAFRQEVYTFVKIAIA